MNSPYQFHSSKISGEEHAVEAHINSIFEGQQIALSGQGNGPIDAAAKALAQHTGKTITVVDYHEHGLGAGSDVAAVCYVEIKIGESQPIFGVGQDENITTAAIKALINGVNRLILQAA